MLRICRQLVGFLIRFSPSQRFTDFLLWPVSKRLFKNYREIVSVARNIKMEVYGDMEDMVNKTLLFMTGKKELSWEPVTTRLVAELSLSSPIAVVAGAHIGYYPLVVSANSPSITVLSFEPNPKNYERFVRNISLNNFTNIVPSQMALGDKVGEQKMYFDFGQSSFVDSRRKHAGEGNVSITTLDEEFKDKLDGPDLMIFDAEGFEANILRGGAKTINKFKPNMILEINPKALIAAGTSTQELYRLIAKEGYSIFIIDDDYSHSLNTKSGLKIRLMPYSEDRLENVSFVNAFATMEPNRFSHYIQK